MSNMRLTPEQKQARTQVAETRMRVLERKERTRKLIQMGGVLAAYGSESTEQVDELLHAIVDDQENWQRLRERRVTVTDRWPDIVPPKWDRRGDAG